MMETTPIGNEDLKRLKALRELGRDREKGFRKTRRNRWIFFSAGFLILLLTTMFFEGIHDLLKIFLLPLAGAFIGLSAVQRMALRNLPVVLSVVDWEKVDKMIGESPAETDR